MFLDAVLIGVVLAIAANIRPFLSWLPTAYQVSKPLILPYPLYILFPLVWVALMMSSAVYDGRRNYYFLDELISVTFGSLLATLCLAGISYFSFRDVSRLMFLSFSGLAYAMLVGWRMGARMIFRLNSKGNGKRQRVYIIGNAELVEKIKQRLMDNPLIKWELNCIISSHNTFIDEKLPEKHYSHYDLGKMIVSNGGSDVILAFNPNEYERVEQVIAVLQEYPLQLWALPTYYYLTLYKIEVEDVAGILLFDLRAPALTEYQWVAKRLFDVILTVISLPLIVPICVAIGVAIKLDSRGSIFFRQKRLGMNGALIEILKFRTMVADAEKKLQELLAKDDALRQQYMRHHKLSNDPRITRVGRWLRKYSLDELPQLWNVLKGEMSLVGPRAYMPNERDEIGPYSDIILRIRPGLTGWWQVMGRHLTLFNERLVLDAYYIKNWSLWLDAFIIIKTIKVIFKGEGA